MKPLTLLLAALATSSPPPRHLLATSSSLTVAADPTLGTQVEQKWKTSTGYELLDHLAKTHNADTSRLYLTGLSMGGYGTWRMATDHPEKFAAAAPVCGAGNPDDAGSLKKVPLWVWHGTEDKAVPY